MVDRPTATQAGQPGSGPAGHDVPRWAGAVAGAAAAWLALGVGELAAGAIDALPSPLLLVAGAVVAASPPALTDWAIDGLGTQSTAVLQVGVVVVLGALGGGLGVLARQRRAAASAGVGALAMVVPALAALQADQGVWPAAGVAVVMTAAGLVVLHGLIGRAQRLGTATTGDDQAPEASGADDSAADAGAPDAGAPHASGGQASAAEPGRSVPRRRFLRTSFAVMAGAVVTGVTGGWLTSSGRAEEARAAADLPLPPDPLPPPPPGAELDVEQITSLYTPNWNFYVVDTAVRRPRVDPAEWRLQITGRVDRPFSLDYDELLDLATDEVDVLLACVSNQVGGDLAGMARWQGIRLDDLLDRAGISADAEQIMGRSVDGFTAGFPVEVLDGRDAIVAVGMNGEPLPVQHGFPARLVVPGLYGYVSATKWLEEIELTTWDVDGYWVPRGWAKQGPIKIASRIDRPVPAAQVEPGTVTLAGVAWAPMAGVAEVEVRVDDGPWQPARLAESIGAAGWRQWAFDWEAPAGAHDIAVRAIDGDGAVQTDDETDPRPDGATGHHRIALRVGA